MHNSIKGALAAVAGGTLLLGGAGSLAYWTDEAADGGTTLAAGTLTLGSPLCGGWKFEAGAGGAVAGKEIVPGDVLTQVCTFAVDAEGENIAAALDVTTPTWDAATDLTADLVIDADYEVGGTPVVDGTEDNIPVIDGDVLTATVTVTFDGPGGDNLSRDGSAVLDDITVTATQSYDPS